MQEKKEDSTRKFLSNLSTTKNNDHNLWKVTKNISQPKKRNVPIKDTNGAWCRSAETKVSAFKDYLEDTFTPFAFSTGIQNVEITDFLDVPAKCIVQLRPSNSKK